MSEIRGHWTGDAGDIVAGMPILRKLGGGHVTIGNHYKAKEGRHRIIKGEKYNSIKPLLLGQDYVTGVRYSEDRSEATHDFSDWRVHYSPHRTLTESQAALFGIGDIDFSPWLKVEPSEETKGIVVINRTMRYNNSKFPWEKYLNLYKGRMMFIGFKQEYDAFVNKLGVQVDYRPIKDLLEAAQLISGSELFIGNQSCCMWIAMGLGHNLVQETFYPQPDSIVPRPNAKYIGGMEVIEQPKHMNGSIPHGGIKIIKESQEKILLALQYYSGDREEALELAEIIYSIQEKSPNKHADFAFSFHRLAEPPPKELVSKLQKAFEQVHVFKGTRSEVGHPGGCNAVWHETINEAAMIQNRGYSAIFTFEPDGVPLELDWVEQLRQEWLANQPCHALGHIAMPPEHTISHMNGNAVFSHNIANDLRLRGCPIAHPWDWYHAPKLKPHWKASELIFNHYNTREITKDILFGPKVRRCYPYNGKEIKPVWYHGVKDSSARVLVKEKLEL